MQKVVMNSENCIDLTTDSDEECPKKEPNTEKSNLLDLNDETHVKIVKKENKRQSPRKAKVKENKMQVIDNRSPKYFKKLLEKAFTDVSMCVNNTMTISRQYGIPEDVILERIYSRPLPEICDVLTKSEEKNLVNWIILSNKNNAIIFRHHLLERVGKYKKVAKITPIFSRSKFGLRWYQYFLSRHHEVYDNDGLLMPTQEIDSAEDSMDDDWGPSTSQWPDEEDIKLAQEVFGPRQLRIKKEEPSELLISLGIKRAVVILHDFRKQKDSPFKLDEKGTTYLKNIKEELNSSEARNGITVDKHHSEQSDINIKVEEPEKCHVMLNDSDSEIEIYNGKLTEITHVKLNESDSEIDDKTEVREMCHAQLNESESDIENNKQDPENYHIQLHDGESDIEINSPDLKLYENGILELKQERNVDESTIGRDISNLPNSSKTKRKYRKRKKNVNLGTPTCEKCVRTFCNHSKLKRHMYIHMPVEQYSFSCKTCSKKFPSKYHLKVHLTITHSRRFFKCSDCSNKVFKHRTSLRNHQRQYHFNLVEPNGDVTNKRVVDCKSDSTTRKTQNSDFICHVCEKHFIYKNSLESHIRYIHLKEEKRFSCNVCKRKFIKQSALMRHKLRHSKIKKLSCSYCSKTYSRKYLLREHIQVHMHKREEQDVETEYNKMSNDEYLKHIKLE